MAKALLVDDDEYGAGVTTGVGVAVAGGVVIVVLVLMLEVVVSGSGSSVCWGHEAEVGKLGVPEMTTWSHKFVAKSTTVC